ncbi:MAG TPA: TIGR03013 family XrtA/PEP-CTERM system glycosyltransferase [Usitatibacter sp.]|nr:TIGR03013 family XrtA/PEP-CTERM system glycosyltransferase [Usitatibacter sp.]
MDVELGDGGAGGAATQSFAASAIAFKAPSSASTLPVARSAIAAASPAADPAPEPMVRSVRVFRGHYHRLLLVATAEAAMVALALYVAVAMRFGEWQLRAMEAALGALWPRALAAVAIMAACLAAMGLYHLRQRLSFSGIAARIVAAVAMCEFLLAFLFYALPGLFVGRGVMLIMAPLAAAGLLAVRFFVAPLLDSEMFKRRVLVWGSGREAAAIGTRLRRRSDQRGFRVVGYVQCAGDDVHVASTVSLESRALLMRYLAANRVEEIVVAMDDRRNGFPTDLLRECRMRGVRMRDIVAFLEEESGHVNVEIAKPSWLIFSEGFHCDVLRASGKRAFDITVALAVLLLSLPITLVAALLIRLEDGGPIFYRQVRTGQHGRPFRMIKFRSMGIDAESNGAVWAQKNDPRVTRIGAFIRKTRIDEIPQAINVLLGQMSFVGPRPERPEFVESLGKRIPFYMERHFVKPGITGWAQVSFPYGSTEDDAREKLGYDLYYVKNHNLLFDLMVLLRTVEIVAFRVGSR